MPDYNLKACACKVRRSVLANDKLIIAGTHQRDKIQVAGFS